MQTDVQKIMDLDLMDVCSEASPDFLPICGHHISSRSSSSFFPLPLSWNLAAKS